MLLGRDDVLSLPDAPVPAGYSLRQYQAGDGPQWVELLTYGDFSEFNLEWFKGYIEGPERRECSYVVVKDGVIIAATFASVQKGEAEVGKLDLVVNHPDHRGKGLGRVVCTAVLRHLAGRGYQKMILLTDDWRLPAIGLYLSLGFVPRMTHKDMPDRWDAIMQRLKSSR